MKRAFIFVSAVVFVGVFAIVVLHGMRENKIAALQREVKTLRDPMARRAIAAWDELTTPPTVGQLQQMLVMRGYDIRIDGRLGPETVRAWQQWECDQAAGRTMGASDE